MPKYLRASPTDQLMFINKTNSDGQMHGVLAFHGRVDAARMARAVRLSLDAEPVLGCRMVKGPLRLRWMRSGELNGIDLCPVVETRDPWAEAMKFMAAPMDAFTAPQVHVRLFRGDVDLLCVKMTHAVADGGGFKEYLNLLASIYRQVGIDPVYRSVPNLDGSRGPWQLSGQVGLSVLARSSLQISIPKLEWCFPQNGNDRSGRSFLTAEPGPEVSASIKAFARSHGVTVNDLLLTAYYRTLFRVLNPPTGKPLPMTVPVNLRRYLPSGKAGGVCTLSGLFIPTISRVPGESFEGTLARIHDNMEMAKKNRVDLSQVLFLQSAFIAGYRPLSFISEHLMKSRAQALMTIPCFSNLGVVDPAALDFGDVKVSDVSLFGPVTFPPYLDFTVYSCGDRLRCSVAYCDSSADVTLVQSLPDAFLNELSGLK